MMRKKTQTYFQINTYKRLSIIQGEEVNFFSCYTFQRKKNVPKLSLTMTSDLLTEVLVTMMGFSSLTGALFSPPNKDGATSSILSSILLQSDVLALLAGSLTAEHEISTPLSSASFLIISLKSSSK